MNEVKGKRIELVVDGKNLITEVYTNESGAYVAITPICDAIGIAENKQSKRLKKDTKFNPDLKVGVGFDGKKREMVCLPVEEIGMWLCSINSTRIKKEAVVALLKFQKHCQVELTAAIRGDTGGTSLVSALKAQVEVLAKQMAILVENDKLKTQQLADTNKLVEKLADALFQVQAENNRLRVAENYRQQSSKLKRSAAGKELAAAKAEKKAEEWMQ